MFRLFSQGKTKEGKRVKIKSLVGGKKFQIPTGKIKLLEEEINWAKDKVRHIGQEKREKIVEDSISALKSEENEIISFLKDYFPLSEEEAKKEVKRAVDIGYKALSFLYQKKEALPEIGEIPLSFPVGVVIWRPCPFTSLRDISLKVFSSLATGNRLIIIPHPENSLLPLFIIKACWKKEELRDFLSLIPLEFPPNIETLKKASRAYMPFKEGEFGENIERTGNAAFVIEEKGLIPSAIKRAVKSLKLNLGYTPLNPGVLLVHESIYYDFLSSLIGILENLEVKEIEEDYLSSLTSLRERLINSLGKFVLGGFANGKLSYPAVGAEIPLSMTIEEEIKGPILLVYEFSKEDDVISFINSSPAIMAVSTFGMDGMEERILKETEVERVNIENFNPDEDNLRGRGTFLFQSRGVRFHMEELTKTKTIRMKID